MPASVRRDFVCCSAGFTSRNTHVLQFYARGTFTSPVITGFRYDSGLVGKAKLQILSIPVAILSALDYPLRWMSGGEQRFCLPVMPPWLPVFFSGMHASHSALSKSISDTLVHCRTAGLPAKACQVLPSQLQCRARCQAVGPVSRNRRTEQRPHSEMTTSASHCWTAMPDSRMKPGRSCDTASHRH